MKHSLNKGTAKESILANFSEQQNLEDTLNNKQNKLVSGTTIKTVNGESLLGSGDIEIQDKLVSGTNIKTFNGESVLGEGDITIEGGGASAHVEGDALVINNSGGTSSGTGSSGGTSIVDVFELPENPDPNTMYRVTYHKIYQMYFNEDGMELLQDIEPLTILGGGKLNIYTLEELPNNPLPMVEGTNFNFYVIQENLYTYYNNTWVNNNDVCAIIGSLVGSTLTYGGLSNYYKTDFENNTIYIYKYTDLYLGSNRIDSEQLIYSGLHQTINDNNSLYKVIKIPPYVLSPIQNLTIRLTGGNAQEKWVFKPNVEWGGFIFLPTLTDINPLTMTSLQDPHWISGSIATIVDLDNDKKTWIILIGDHSPDADVYYKVEIYGK